MIQTVFNSMITFMLAKFMINDLPHAAGLLDNPNTATDASWDNVWKSCVQAAKILGKELTEQDMPANWPELRRLHKDLWAQVYGKRRLKSGNPVPTGTCYRDAWRFLIKEEEGELVHGTVWSEGGERTVKHAWVDLPTGYVWEPQTEKYYSAMGFQQSFIPLDEHRYTVEEAAIMVARTGNHGPWTDEEKIEYIGR